MTGRWALLRYPPRVWGCVLGIEFVAVLATVLCGLLAPVRPADLARFGMLALCLVVHVELSRRTELQRERGIDGRQIYVDTRAVWSFAAVLVLPPLLATALVVLTFALYWVRILARQPGNPPYRVLLSTATIVCGTQAAALVLWAGMTRYPGIPVAAFPGTLRDVAVVLLAAVVRWAVNYGLVATVVWLDDPAARPSPYVLHLRDQVVEIGSYGLGLLAAVTVVTVPLALIGVLASSAALNQVTMVHQYQHSARVDAKTGLASAHWWRENAERALRRAGGGPSTVGLLLLDLDHFKAVNDRYGHLTGDAVLRAVADVLDAETRASDVCCRWGGEEFAALLFDVDAESALRSVGERIRRRVEALVVQVGTASGPPVTGISVSIGAARYDGTSGIDELVAAADVALYRAKGLGRNRLVLAG